MPFDAHTFAVELVTLLKPLVARVATHDSELAGQLRRAATSAPLNLAEGRKRVGRDRLHLWRIAAGSVAEVRSALEVSVAWGYLEGAETEEAVALCDRLGAITWRLTN
jgi:four helix bundle protein